MIPICVIRPEPGCSTTTAAARRMGLETQGFPLFRIVPMPWNAPAADTFDALLIGSANALRHGGSGLAEYSGKPAYVAGEATAEAARAAGFVIAGIGRSGLQPVLDRASHARLLRLAGADHIALTAPVGITVIERIVYASEALPMPAALVDALAKRSIVVLHSATAARHFADECQRLAIDISQLKIATIGPRVSAAVGPGWDTVVAAAEPSDEALLALARQLCQTPAS